MKPLMRAGARTLRGAGKTLWTLAKPLGLLVIGIFIGAGTLSGERLGVIVAERPDDGGNVIRVQRPLLGCRYAGLFGTRAQFWWAGPWQDSDKPVTMKVNGEYSWAIFFDDTHPHWGRLPRAEALSCPVLMPRDEKVFPVHLFEFAFENEPAD